jgi:hypothetical protein
MAKRKTQHSATGPWLDKELSDIRNAFLTDTFVVALHIPKNVAGLSNEQLAQIVRQQIHSVPDSCAA